MSNIYFTSDTHFFHERVIEYSSRPFNTVYEMNEALVTNWNAHVQPDDIVWHLGDFALKCNYTQTEKILHRLNGNIHFIYGNHDKIIEKNQDKLLSSGLLKSIQHYKEFEYNGYRFVLFHYALRTWHWAFRGTIHCFGHSHNKLPPFKRSLDVGVDSTVITTEYRPVSIDEIITWAEQQKEDK